MRNLKFLATAIALCIASAANAELVRKESAHNFEQTVKRLEGAIKERGLNVFARVDHADGAKQVGQSLRPTILFIFGSPAVGTALIQAEQTLGLSLPLKILVWRDAAGKVWLGYDAPAGMAAERGVARDNPVVGRISGALDGLTSAVVKR